MRRNVTLERLVDERDRVHSAIDDILAIVETDERDPSETERELLTRHRARLATLEPMIVELVDQEEQFDSSRDARTVLERGRQTTTQPRGPEPHADAPVVYRTFGEWARDELIMRFDAIATRSGAPREAAQGRLTRAVANTLTSDVPGLLPPQHIAEIVQVIQRNRPIVESARRVSLQNGKLTYPRITQRPTVSKQNAEKTETPSQKMTVAMEDVLADTYLGAGDLSWQTINWTVPDALALWFQLAAEAYAKQTETAAGAVLIAAAAANATVVASNDLAGWYAAITAAAGAVYARSGHIADTIWSSVGTAFLLAGMVSSTAPVFNPAGGIDPTTGTGRVASMSLVPSPGLPAGNIIVGASQAFLCAETAGAPVELRAVEPSIGGMEVGVIGAFAAEALDPLAFQKVTPPTGVILEEPVAPTSGGK